MYHYVLRYLQSYFSSLLHVLVKKYALRLHNVFKIQIGANDGKSIDLVHGIIVANDATAILGEPVLHVFEKLNEPYAHASCIITLQLAITGNPKETSKAFYYLKPREGEQYNNS